MCNLIAILVRETVNLSSCTPFVTRLIRHCNSIIKGVLIVYRLISIIIDTFFVSWWWIKINYIPLDCKEKSGHVCEWRMVPVLNGRICHGSKAATVNWTPWLMERANVVATTITQPQPPWNWCLSWNQFRSKKNLKDNIIYPLDSNVVG